MADREEMVKLAEQQYALAQALRTPEGRTQVAQTLFEP